MEQEKQDQTVDSGMNRRVFLKHLGATGTALGLFPTVHSLAFAQQATPTADALVTGKDPKMIVRNSNPVELETPLDLLGQHATTPKNLMYIRNNQDLKGFLTTEAPKVEGWDLEIVGLVKAPQKIALAKIKEMPSEELEMAFQCSGNGRAFYSKIARASGAQWENGSMANVRWKGSKLAGVLEAVGVAPEALFLTAEGADVPTREGAADVERSVPLAEVLPTALLAYEMNGEPIPAVHGGPLRLVLPGFFGINNIKWLNKLRLEAKPSTNNTMVPRYRVPSAPVKPGSTFTYTQENSRPNYKQQIKSVIFAPLEGATVRSVVEVRGVAWNDGSAPITSVEVSADQGKTWRAATIQQPSGPYAWHRFSVRVILGKGERELWVRATDALGRSQPLDGNLTWNPNGYEWNALHRVKVAVS
jgi:DMSO/TMAO reductase YedYZ molybdopterin-dependent catalytic subunit